MCFICGASCIGERTECGFVREFCEACLVEYDMPFLCRVMEARHASVCGCPDVGDSLVPEIRTEAERPSALVN